MAWCNGCGKSGLQKKDVELDDLTKQILCIDCFKQVHPEFSPEIVVLEAHPVSAVSYELHLSQERGLEAKIGYKGFTIALQAPQQDIRRLFER